MMNILFVASWEAMIVDVREREKYNWVMEGSSWEGSFIQLLHVIFKNSLYRKGSFRFYFDFLPFLDSLLVTYLIEHIFLFTESTKNYP